MMNNKNRLINNRVVVFVAAVFLLSIQNAAMADWDGGIEGGTVLSGDGGSASRLRLKLSNDAKPLSHYIYGDWLRGDQGGNSFELGYKPRYWFAETLYVFGEAKARRDKLHNIDRSLFGLTGIGWQLFNSEQRSLFAELGAGYLTTESASVEDSESTAVARVGYKQILGDLLSLELDADTNIGEVISSGVMEAGIAVRVPGGALKYSYRTQRYKSGNETAVTNSDSFVSFSYGF